MSPDNESIAFQIKILGALSVGDGREKAYPLPAAFLKSLSEKLEIIYRVPAKGYLSRYSLEIYHE